MIPINNKYIIKITPTDKTITGSIVSKLNPAELLMATEEISTDKTADIILIDLQRV